MTCNEFAELFDLYAIGLLEDPELAAVRSHLDTGCGECGPRFINALMQAAQISETLPLVDPPVSLRDRVAASVGAGSKLTVMPRKKVLSSIAPWLLAAASVTAWLIGLRSEENERRTQRASQAIALESANRASSEHTAAMLAILQSPSTRKVEFNINESNLPHGSLFIHKELGVAMVVAHLPAVPAGYKYESWVVPKAGAPRPVESFNTETGFAFTVAKGPVDLTQLAAMAVSIEPADSTPVKPTKVLFASPV